MSHVLKKSLMGAALLISLALSSHSLAAPANEAPPAPVTAQATANPVAPVAPLAPDATATATTAATAATAATTAATAEGNPYGLGALWAQGDAVAKGTLLILVLMSMGSWYVIFSKFTAQAKMQQFAKAAQADFWNSGSVRQATDALDPASPFRFIAEKGLEGASKHEGLLGSVDFNTWVTMSIQRAMGTVQSRLQDGLAVLATVGSTAPFVGLFGTVWGIYHALVKIGMSGQASIDKVAGPVGEALIMTAIGLAVAVPAVLGYNWLVRRNKAVMEEVNAFGADLHAVLLASAPK